jgi:hypothetical protein
MLFAVCETIYNENQVEDNVPDCYTDTEEICSKTKATGEDVCRDVAKECAQLTKRQTPR